MENSAPSQARPAKSVVWASSLIAKRGVTRVADVGCGRLRNLGVLRKHFEEIILVDTELQCRRIRSLVPEATGIRLLTSSQFGQLRGRLDAAFLISVLHVIPSKRQREELLAAVVSKVRRGGYLVVDVPSGVSYYRTRCTPDKRYRDGWAMGAGPRRTFYKNYTAHELDRLLLIDGSLSLLAKPWLGKHLIRLMRKC